MNLIETWLLQGVEEAIPKVKMLAGNRINIHEPRFETAPIDGLADLLGGEEKVICAIGMNLMEKSPLKLLMVMDHETRAKIASAVLGGRKADARMEVSVLQEMGNIFGSSVANCLSRYLEIPIKTSIPEPAEDMAGSVISAILATSDELDDDAYILETSVCIDDVPSKCTFFLLSSLRLHDKLAKFVARQ